MEKVLRTKTVIIFLILVLPLVAADIIEDQFTHSLLYIIYYIAHFGYYLVTYDICSKKFESENSLGFLLSIFLLLIFFGSMTILVQPGDSIEFSGMLGSIFTLAFLASLSYSLYFISGLQIKYTLGVKKLDTFNYFIHILFFFFLPIGVWVLYPRLRLAYDKEKLKKLF